MDKRAHLMIYGDVTGVGYRYWARIEARKLALTGFVRNVVSGVVEVVVEGETEKVREMIERCKKGPEVAWIEKVEVAWEKATGEFMEFEVRL